MFTVNKDKKEVSPVETLTFKQAGLEERKDLQEWIAKSPNIFGEELLIIQKEFDKFDKTAERFDLLALDKKGRLVIIENKRDTSDKDVVWQALKYGAYCSTLTTSQIISIYQDYLDKHDKDNDAKERICDFFDNADIETLDLNAGENQRFILVAGKFPPEVTSTALWLIKNNIDVQCFKVALFSLNEELLLNVSKIIPIPDAEDYMIRLATKNVEEKQTAKNVSTKKELYLKFWKKTLDIFKEQNISTFDNISPSESSYISGSTGIPTCRYDLNFLKDSIRIDFYIDRASKEENKKIYDYIHERKETLEKNFGNKMKWQRLDDKKASRISYGAPFDSYDEENWDDIIEWFAEHFQKLETSIKPIIKDNRFHKK